MALSERKKKVLRSIVDLYIRTAEPVGSKAIAALPDMKYSSATIRNEMAELTTLGYLEQPHTSAGRIPSAAGYRLYVDELMMDYRLSIDEAKSINTVIDEKMQRMDKMVERVAKLVSQATNLPAISLRMVAEEYFMSGSSVMALEPTGSAVRIYRSTTLRRTFFFRSVSSMNSPPFR